jgi:hypothetical protein
VFEVWRLNRRRRKIIARADRDRAKALEHDDMKRANEIAMESFLACQRIDERTSRFLDSEIRQEAQELDLEFPPLEDDGMWNRGNDQSLILKFRGRAFLRERIDKEKTRRFEVKTLWVTKIILPLAGVLVGIIGALTGLFAILRHKK